MPIPQLSRKTYSPKNWKKKKSPFKKRKASFKVARKSFKNKSIKKTRGLKVKRLNNYYKFKPSVLITFIKRLIPILLLTFLSCIVIIAGMFVWYSRDLPNPDQVINRQIAESTKIYDRTGETVLYDIHGDIQRTTIELKELPEYVTLATIAIEDKDFYKHKGVSLWGILRGQIMPRLKGRRAQGGSTLTQQFVKNAILTNERRLSRKLKEIIIAYQLEKKFTKEQILKMYFNEIPYGSTIYGIEAASQSFFAKSAKDLSLSEAAILAALPQAPTYYSPYGSNVNKLFNRQQVVLSLMANQNYISQEQANKAKEEKVAFKPKREGIIAPHFVMYVKELLTQKFGELTIAQEGLKVITTLDLDKQKFAEEAIANQVEINQENHNANNASLVAINPKTGEVLSMVGSKDFFNEEIDGQVNIALRPRQPGSSFKPIVYTAAFIKGYTPSTVLYDVETIFKTNVEGDYVPKNYNDKTFGPVTIAKALGGSLNIPAIKTIYLTGVDNVLDFAEKLGYTTLEERSRFGLSLVLGGGEVKLLEHAAALGVFANQGTKKETAVILKVTDNHGKVLFEHDTESEKRVLDEKICNQINSILSNNENRAFVFGESNFLTLESRQVAAKTGTTNNFRDAWTIGYSPSLVTGVWVGNNDNTEMTNGAVGGRLAAPIWNEFMRNALKDTSIEYFTAPEKIITGKAILDGSITGQTKIKIDKASGKLATKLTPSTYIEERTYHQIHNILHYVNKDDPQGAIPDNPIKDNQYANWEEAVQLWAEENEYFIQDPPTEYDDLHIQENKPTIAIINPVNKQTITSTNIIFQISASSPRGVKKAIYYLDGRMIGQNSNQNSNFSLNKNLSHLKNGFHSLKVQVFDDIQNSNEIEIDFNLLLGQ